LNESSKKKREIFRQLEKLYTFAALKQNKKQKMKKVLSFTAIAALAAMVACGPSQEEIDAKNKQTRDSMMADSTRKADDAMRMTDSTNKANEAKAAWEKQVADSTAMADSLAKKGGKKK
jgi:hypothetical protein